MATPRGANRYSMFSELSILFVWCQSIDRLVVSQVLDVITPRHFAAPDALDIGRCGPTQASSSESTVVCGLLVH
jgi:hypothetical protein